MASELEARVIAAVRLMTHDYYMLLDGEVSVPWPHHLEELTAALRALDAEPDVLDCGEVKYDKDGDLVTCSLEECVMLGCPKHPRFLDAEPDAPGEQKHFVSGEQVLKEYVPGYERRRRPTYGWEPDVPDAGERPPDPLVEFFGWVCTCGKEHARDSLPYGIHVCECGYEQAFPTVGYMETQNPDGSWPRDTQPAGVVTTAVYCAPATDIPCVYMAGEMIPSHPFFMDDNVTRTNGVEDEKPGRGEFEIERVDNGYFVNIFRDGVLPVRLAFECKCGVADAVMEWLGYVVTEKGLEVLAWLDDEENYVLSDKARETLERARIDTLKRGSGRNHPLDGSRGW